MTGFPRTGNYPETLLHILLTIIKQTPAGGATMEDLLEAYREIKDRKPSQRTIYRIINRLNLYFDPLAYGETPDEDEVTNGDPSKEELEVLPRVIRTEKRNGKTYYIYCDDLSSPDMDQGDLLLTILSFYHQQRSVLKDYYELILKRAFKDILAGMSAYTRMISEIEKYIYVSGAVPSDTGKSVRMIKDIMQAFRRRKRVRFRYMRSYDGVLVEREVEPYGLLCRLNNWYLIGKCLERQSERVYLILNIRSLDIVEGSSYRLPPEYSLQKTYRGRWGIWTGDNADKPEKVCLRVLRGFAERFRNNLYHDSQKTFEFSGGDLKVTYTIRGAHEMIPWLMSWGTAVEVLEPQWLKEKLIIAHKNALKHLTDDGNKGGDFDEIR